MFHPLSIDALQQAREHDILEIRGALRNCTSTVKSGQSSPRALPSRWDLCSTTSFLTMPCTSLHLHHDVLQHRAFLLDVVVRQCLPVFGPLPSHGRWCHWPSTSNVVVWRVNVLMKICMPPRNVSCSASEVTGCAACARDCDHAFGCLRLPRLPAFGTPSAFWHASWSFRPLHVLHVEYLGNLGMLVTWRPKFFQQVTTLLRLAPELCPPTACSPL